MATIADLVMGLQHIGIPTNSIEKTIDFFTSLGFTAIYETENDGERVIFLKLGHMIIETYESQQATMKHGAIDHIALNVSDINRMFSLVKELGYHAIEEDIQTLPFFENGISYFTIVGPNAEKVEFSQYL